jgi:alcohol dehydrogenase (cytochrome c)
VIVGQKPKRHLLKLVIIIVIFVGAAATAGLYFKIKSVANQNIGHQTDWRAYSWRAQLALRKATGQIPGLSWGELWEMMRQPGGFSLQDIFSNGVSLEGALANPLTETEDIKIGGRIFRERCAQCHGTDGAGLHAPPLNRPGYKHGDSDLSVYKVLRDGVPNTEMVATNLSFVERWQVCGYLKNLQLHFASSDKVRSAPNIPKVTSEQIEAYENRPGEWLTYSGSLSGWRYSPLAEITPANISNLRVRWIRRFRSEDVKYESTPLVVGGVIFVTVPPAKVIAIDAKTGAEIWQYTRTLPDNLPVCCGRVNRGLAILGDTLFFGSFDGYLVAIDAQNGKVIWQIEVAKSSDGYSMTGAPLVVKDSVIVGVAGGEFGIRGMLAAFDAATGQQRWKFDTIPGPGEFGHETWKGDSWKTGSGSTWVTGSYDPSLDLVYWGVANPGPPFQGDGRPGDNLFTNSAVALNASSGQLVWYFQFTPHDEHDWDSAQTPILADILIKGAKRKVICWPNRNGFYYVLDRITGEFLLGEAFVEQNWAEGLTATGRPIPLKHSEISAAGRLISPGVIGGMNWQPAAFDPRKGLIFVPAVEGASVFSKSDNIARGKTGRLAGSAGADTEPPKLFVRALDVATGARRWEYSSGHEKMPDHSGLLATAGGLVFGASEGAFFALDADTGQELWRVPLALGEFTEAPPISFALDGRQEIAILAGSALVVFGL